MSKIRGLFEEYLTRKIGAEIKCCLTFLLILCYYCAYKLVIGFEAAGILHMFEMVWTAYILEWIQVLLHSDFDEVDRLSLKEWFVVLGGSLIYALISLLCGWFAGNIPVTIGFFVYMIVAYLCTYLIYKIKRTIDAKMLNNDLRAFQEKFRANELMEEKYE